jgi:hypothetical protein
MHPTVGDGYGLRAMPEPRPCSGAGLVHRSRDSVSSNFPKPSAARRAGYIVTPRPSRECRCSRTASSRTRSYSWPERFANGSQTTRRPAARCCAFRSGAGGWYDLARGETQTEAAPRHPATSRRIVPTASPRKFMTGPDPTVNMGARILRLDARAFRLHAMEDMAREHHHNRQQIESKATRISRAMWWVSLEVVLLGLALFLF